jgi:hypothetical protein
VHGQLLAEAESAAERYGVVLVGCAEFFGAGHAG